MTIQVPAYQFHFNLAVCPLPDSALKTVRYWKIIGQNLYLKHYFRARATSMFLRTMVLSPRPLVDVTAWSSCQTTYTTSYHLSMQKKGSPECTATLLSFWLILTSAQRFHPSSSAHEHMTGCLLKEKNRKHNPRETQRKISCNLHCLLKKGNRTCNLRKVSYTLQ